MSDNEDGVRRRIDELRASSEGLQKEINEHEDMIFAGQEDPRHILRIGQCYKQIADNSYEEGKLAGKLEFIQDRVEDRTKTTRDEVNEDRWEARSEPDKINQENWWRDEKTPERAEPEHEPSQDDDRYRR